MRADSTAHTHPCASHIPHHNLIDPASRYTNPLQLSAAPAAPPDPLQPVPSLVASSSLFPCLALGPFQTLLNHFLQISLNTAQSPLRPNPTGPQAPQVYIGSINNEAGTTLFLCLWHSGLVILQVHALLKAEDRTPLVEQRSPQSTWAMCTSYHAASIELSRHRESEL